ncbi:tyrosine-type recombinase/integrase [Corynebacterium variabile]|uniref:tyrosine-type recombinase/integrase n=1 Tax=Corynebacterium variabile TaxID=1727 RepID=UPI003F9687AC
MGRPLLRRRRRAARQIFDTEKAAIAFEQAQAVSVRSGTYIAPEDAATPLGVIAREWLAEATKENTVSNRQALVDNLGPLDRTPVGKIRASTITAWRNQLTGGRPWQQGKPLAESTAATMVGQVCGLLKRAHEDGMIGRVPVVKIPKAAPERAVSRQDLLTVAEVATLITATRDGKPAPRQKNGRRQPHTKASPKRPEAARMMQAVVVGAGLRISEIAGLRVQDVDTLRRTITVNGQVAPGGARWVPVPKTEKSHRTIPVAEETILVIAEQLREHPQLDRSGPVFPYRGTSRSVKDRVWHDRASLGSVMRAVIAAHGLREVGWHDLRDFYASALIAAGSPASEVQAAMGHAKASTTLDIYTHLWPKADARIRDAAAGVLDLVRAEKGQNGEITASDDLTGDDSCAVQ